MCVRACVVDCLLAESNSGHCKMVRVFLPMSVARDLQSYFFFFFSDFILITMEEYPFFDPLNIFKQILFSTSSIS